MGSFFQRKPVRLARLVFRWCRIVVLFGVFLAVAALAYFHLIGLPEFVKQPLLREIRRRGFEARFSEARLAWGPSIVVRNAAFLPIGPSFIPRLSAGRAELALNGNALLRRRLHVDSFSVINGRMQVPLSETNGEELSLDEVGLRVAFLTNQLARLSDFHADFRGIDIRINGDLSDYGVWRRRKPAGSGIKTNAPPPARTLDAYRGQLRRLADILTKYEFRGTPALEINFAAAGQDANSLRAEASFTTGWALTPLGAIENFHLRAACAHILDETGKPIFDMETSADKVATRWGTSDHLSLAASFTRQASSNLEGTVNLAAAGLRAAWGQPPGSNWIRAASLSWDGAVTLPVSNFIPVAMTGKWCVAGADSPWGSAGGVTLEWAGRRFAPGAPGDASWGWWTNIQPYAFEWQAAASNVLTPKLQLESAALRGRWRAPQVTVEELRAQLYHGRLDGGGALDVATRAVDLHAAADFDPHGAEALLTAAARRWIAQYAWQAPPRVQANMRLVLPPWTQRAEGWEADLRSSVQLAGEFSVGPASFRGVSVTSARSHVTYTNRVWGVPDLHAARADGELDVDYTGNETTHEYRFRFDSRLDPADAVSLLSPEQELWLREVHFLQPPEIRAEVRGRWRARQTIAFSGTIAAANCLVHGEAVDELGAAFDYTNNFARASNLRLAKGPARAAADLVVADLASNTIVLTNASGTLDLALVRRVLGTNTPDFLNRVRFDAPLSARADGSFCLTDPRATDLRIAVRGERFHWTNLYADKITGTVRWEGRNVTVTNIEAEAYNSGRLAGWLVFDYSPGRGTPFHTDFSARNIDLSLLARGLTGRSNRLEGRLDARLALSGSLDAGKKTWAGEGYLHVHDALLWDIKIFGLLSPLLNAISPGAGDSRAREASAAFVVANGEVSTDDLEIHGTGLRLLYRGKVDVQKRIHARVEADLLEDTPLFGPFLRLALTPLSKLFEYQITGTLNEPVMKPLYVPKFLLLLLRPFHTLKELLPEAPPPKPKGDK
ncbi:MAG: hypothetical protein ABSG59_11285 [Verrucomicrobiota bacterium]|jgi:hypothetical protein